jgi:uncharacterized protein (TIGR02118 family)
MYKVSVMYPNQPGSRFDVEYYVHHHLKLVQELMAPEGLVKIGVDTGVSNPGQPALYHCIGQLYFSDPSGYERAIQKHAARLQGDIPNFTDVTPIRQLSEVVL